MDKITDVLDGWKTNIASILLIVFGIGRSIGFEFGITQEELIAAINVIFIFLGGLFLFLRQITDRVSGLLKIFK